MATGLIGALRITLGLDASEFQAGTTKAQAQLRGFQRDFAKMGRGMQDMGRSMSTFVTLPILAAGAGMVKMAANFETATNSTQIATQATAAEMEKLRDIAQKIGTDTIFSASEAADGMTMLAKAGIDTKTIIGGAAEAVTNLAAAAGSELEPAASAISDTLTQFNKKASDLPHIVDVITGAVNESKLSFEDYSLAMGQAGGVAGAAGADFDEFAAALAGTSSMFNSGSDAGTSFKTFLMRMTPDTKKAREAMEKYSLSFYDAQGNMRSLRDIAEQLQTKFGDMSESERSGLFRSMFGQDAIRTAIGLMKLGGEGMDKMMAKIQATDAASQAAARMKGLNAQLEQLKGALENLAIALGESGMISAVTNLLTKITDFITRLSELNPALLKWVSIIAVVVAAVGPLLIAVGGIVRAVGFLLPLFAKLAPLFAGSGAAAATAGAAVGGTGLAGGLVALSSIMVPLLATAGALYLVWKNWETISPAISNWAAGFENRIGEVQTYLDGLNGRINEFDQKMGVPTKDDFFKSVEDNAKGAFTGYQAWADETWASIQKLDADLKNWSDRTWESVKAFDAQMAAWSASAWAWVGEMDAKMAAGAASVWASIESNWDKAKAATASLGNSIRQYLVTGLESVWSAVKQRAKEAGDAFYNLWDRVVGHSYIPDMVTGIGVEMAKLDALMTQPTKKATKDTAETFRELASSVNGLLSRLFPEEARHNQFVTELDLIEKAAKKLGWTADETADAIQRLTDEYAKSTLNDLPMFGGQSVDEMGDVVLQRANDDLEKVMDEANKRLPEWGDKNKKTTAEVGMAFVNMSDQAIGSIQNMISAFKDGNLLDALSSIVDLIGTILSGLNQAGILKPNSAGQTAGPQSAPGFSTGGSFKVGGSGGVDSQLMRFRATPGEMVNIDRTGGKGKREAVVIQIRKGEMFDAHVERVARPMVEDGVARGAAGGAVIANRQQFRRQKAQLA